MNLFCGNISTLGHFICHHLYLVLVQLYMFVFFGFFFIYFFFFILSSLTNEQSFFKMVLD